MSAQNDSRRRGGGGGGPSVRSARASTCRRTRSPPSSAGSPSRGDCPGRRAPKRAAKRLARPFKNAAESGLTAENAEGACTPSRGTDRQLGLDEGLLHVERQPAWGAHQRSVPRRPAFIFFQSNTPGRLCRPDVRQNVLVGTRAEMCGGELPL
jgi:hypothetical protein